MRISIVLLGLALAGCSANAHNSDPRLQSKINDSYDARDACLAKNAASYSSSDSDASSVARTISVTCQAETDALIALNNPYNDPRIAAAIRSDTEFRARGFVLKARGQATG